MGHGWKVINKIEIFREPCKCKKGFTIKYEIEEESDYPPFNRVSNTAEQECQNKFDRKI